MPPVSTTSIAELIQAPAQARARAAELIGQTQARALTLSGQGRAQLLQTIGQAGTDVTTSARQLVEQRKVDAANALTMREKQQQIALGDAQLSSMQRATQGRDLLAKAIQAGGDDHKKVYTAMVSAGFPDVAEGYLESATKHDEAWRSLKNGQIADADKALAFEGDQLQRIFQLPDAQRPAAWIAVQGTLKAHGVPTDGLSPIWDNDAAKAQLALTGPKPDLMAVPETSTVINKNDPTAPPIITGTPKAPNSQESKFLLNGKSVQGDYVPGANGQPGKYFYQGQDVTGQASVIPPASIQIQNQNGKNWPGDFEKSGKEFVATIPKQWQRTVEKIANYDEDPTKVASMRGGNREMLTAWVNQVNPSYDASMFTVRAPTRKAFTTGTQGQQITAMNTAIEHLDQLQAAADALANGSFKPGNRAYNYLRDTFGSAMPSNYDTIKNMVDKEVEAVANKGVPTVSGTAEQKALAGTAASPQAIKGYIDTLIPLMGSKVNALHYQYQQAMGPDDPWNPLTPQAKAILEKRGVTPGGTSTAVATAAPVVTATAKEGDTKPIEGHPGTEQTYQGGRWIRTK